MPLFLFFLHVFILCSSESSDFLKEQIILLVSIFTYCIFLFFSQPNFTSNVSPSGGNKTLRKLASLRNRSPTGDSPSSKTRKSAQAAGNLMNFCLIGFFRLLE